MQRQFRTVYTTVETAAEECSRALIGAANTSGSTNATGQPSYDLAAFATGDTQPRGYFSDLPKRHDWARDAVVLQIQADIRAGKHDGDPDDVDVEETIEGGSKSTPGGKGRADIYFDDGETIWIWEVKGSTTEMPPLVDQAKTASKEANDYIAAFKLANPGLDREIKPGWPLEEPITTKYTDFAGQMEDLIIDNTQGGGGIKYRTVPIYIGPTLPPRSPQELSALEKLALGLAGLPFVLTPMGGADAIVPPYFTQPPPTA